MTTDRYNCTTCGSELHYKTTKHNGCPNCGAVPLHSAD
ncbi:hypothetical protein Natoc_3171 [Natronococcus occultus SP4]|uniref:Uncharacterized protein n=1 Tax=Natronococcus occultus SP4 TaxID=694430 RepID=L0K2Y9_9EURY|nr:hypothetical protein Natoc_3171 [Natronococcus occultus SP4]